jgi:hypothetical protein
VRSQVFGTGGRHRDERALSGSATARHETAVAGVFPHRKTRARRPPRLEHVGVRAGFGPHPFQEVEDQGVDVVGHGGRLDWRLLVAARLSQAHHTTGCAPPKLYGEVRQSARADRL